MKSIIMILIVFLISTSLVAGELVSILYKDMNRSISKRTKEINLSEFFLDKSAQLQNKTIIGLAIVGQKVSLKKRGLFTELRPKIILEYNDVQKHFVLNSNRSPHERSYQVLKYYFEQPVSFEEFNSVFIRGGGGLIKIKKVGLIF